jgi:hypothetical protein
MAPRRPGRACRNSDRETPEEERHHCCQLILVLSPVLEETIVAALRRVWRNWRTAVVVVRPETVVGWHRTWLRRRWTRRSTPRANGRPPVGRRSAPSSVRWPPRTRYGERPDPRRVAYARPRRLATSWFVAGKTNVSGALLHVASACRIGYFDRQNQAILHFRFVPPLAGPCRRLLLGEGKKRQRRCGSGHE